MDEEWIHLKETVITCVGDSCELRRLTKGRIKRWWNEEIRELICKRKSAYGHGELGIGKSGN